MDEHYWALSPKDIGRTVIREYNTINAENIASIVIAIRETYPITQKLHIILEGAGYHRNELVKDGAYVILNFIISPHTVHESDRKALETDE